MQPMHNHHQALQVQESPGSRKKLSRLGRATPGTKQVLASVHRIVSARRRHQRALITLAPAQMAKGGHRGWRHRIWTAGPLAAPRHAGEPRAANAAAPQTLVSAPSSWQDEYVSSPTNARIHIQFIAAL